MMVVDGKGILQWAYSSLDPGLVVGGVVINEEEVATRVQQLLDEKEVREKKIVLGLSGLHSITLSIDLPQLPEHMIAEAVMREAARVLPVPLEDLYLTWRRIPAPEEHKVRAFAIAVPRATADSMLRTLARAGLTPLQMEIKPLALTRLIGEPNAVLLDVQPTEYDIVIFGDGIPQPVRTISFPTEDLSWQEKLRMMRDDLIRTMEFYDSRNSENPLVPSVPVYVSGEMAEEPGMCQDLSNELGRSVMVLSLPAKSPTGLSPSRHVVNMGLAAKVLPQKGPPISVVGDLDSLPAAYRLKTFSPARVLTLAGVGLLAVVVMAQLALLQINSSAIASADTRLETVSRIMDQKKDQSRGLITSLVEAEAARDVFTGALDALGKERSTFNTSLQTATSSIPGGVAITGIARDGELLAMSVDSASEAEVLVYARRLESSQRFASVSISRMQRTDTGGMSFVLLLEMKP
jgi:type IV pilus assembly protein PilM